MKAVRVLRRIGVTLLVVVLALLTVGTVGGVWVVRSSLPKYDGQLRLKGLSAPVDVYRDSHGVPQLYAATGEDLFRAQGYLHAQDRFWEMDFRRHVTAGRLAELFGESQVETDSYIRTMGWRRVAEQEYKILSADTRRWLEAYADGVNAWLASHSGRRASLEYAVLKMQNRGYRIEKWSPVDSVAWLKAMAWDLRSNMGDEIARAQLLAEGLPRDLIEQLYPPYPEQRHAPIVTTGGIRKGAFDAAAPTSEVVADARRAPGGGGGVPPAAGSTAGVTAEGAAAQGVMAEGAAAPGVTTEGAAVQGVAAAGIPAARALRAVRQGLERLPALLGPNGSGLGSNSWVVAGSRTESGKPLLANDPHLGPSMPSIWSQMGLHCSTVSPECPFDVSGYTFSGLPGVVIGHNDRMAWGFTNLGPDVVDLYLEKIDGDRYEVDGKQRELTVREEKIKVAGGKTVTIKVRSTGHGPLLSDRDDDLRDIGKKAPVAADGGQVNDAQAASPEYAVALRWTALDPGRTADAIFGLNTASDWKSFRDAVRLFAVPAQNIIYADVEGNIGYQAPGDVPIRQTGDGRWPVPGWESKYDWKGLVPFDALPNVFNPPNGYIATANQEVVRGDYPYLITADWDYGYRSQRITDLIAEHRGKFDVEAISRMQFDSRNGNAAQVVPYLLARDVGAGNGKSELKAAHDLLRGWNYTQPAESAPAAFFNSTWRHLLKRTFDELPDDQQPDGGSRWFEVVRELLDDPGSEWWDDRDTTSKEERRDEILDAAMADAVDELTDRLGADPKEWRWGDLHTLELRNETFGSSDIAPMEWLFNRGPYAASGGDSIVNATGWNAPDGYDVVWVPSMRMVVDLDNLDKSRWVNLTGASGHAFDRYYADQAELWRTGETTPMRWERETIAREAEHRLTLTP
jgi:penicillin amidase